VRKRLPCNLGNRWRDLHPIGTRIVIAQRMIQLDHTFRYVEYNDYAVLICNGELSGLQFVDVFLRKERRGRPSGRQRPLPSNLRVFTPPSPSLWHMLYRFQKRPILGLVLTARVTAECQDSLHRIGFPAAERIIDGVAGAIRRDHLASNTAARRRPAAMPARLRAAPRLLQG